MDSFSSYLELVAAVNFAFVLSTHFIGSISEKISEQYITVLGKLKHVKQLHNDNCNMLVERAEKLTAKAEKVVAGLHEKSKEIAASIKKHDAEVQSVPASLTLIGNFNYFCLFNSLYPILLLLMIGFKVEWETQEVRNTLLCFNVVSIFVLFLIMQLKEWVFPGLKSGFFAIVIGFLSSILITFLIRVSVPSEQLQRDFGFQNLATLLSITIPIAHFIYYFIITIYKTKKTAQSLLTPLARIQEECLRFAQQIHDKCDAVNDITQVESK